MLKLIDRGPSGRPKRFTFMAVVKEDLKLV